MKPIIILVVGLLLTSCNISDNKSNTKESVEGLSNKNLQKSRFSKEIVEAYVPFISPSIPSNDHLFLQYELHIANTYKLPLELVKVEIFDMESKEQPLATYDSIYIIDHLLRPGLEEERIQVFEGNQFGDLNISLSVKNSEIPNQIYHLLHFNVTSNDGEMVTLKLEKALIPFPPPTKLVLKPPFEDGYWFYYTTGHRNTRELTEGKPSYAQRYAIDWAYVEPDGTFVDEDRDNNKSYASYGKKIIAVADGIITEIQDSIPENSGESSERPVRMTRYNLSGNHLVLDIGNDVQVVYAHLIPGSFQHQVGDRVQAGETIGLLGNSGASDGPHLHLHAETKHKMVLGGQGVPFLFQNYHQISIFDPSITLDSLFLGTSLPIQDVGTLKTHEMPQGMGVVAF